MAKDTADKTSESELKAYLADAYLHPIFQSFEEEEEQMVEVRVDKHQTHVARPPSEPSPSSPANYVHHTSSPPQYVYHPPSPPHYMYDQSSPAHYVYGAPPSPPRYIYHHEER